MSVPPGYGNPQGGYPPAAPQSSYPGGNPHQPGYPSQQMGQPGYPTQQAGVYPPSSLGQQSDPLYLWFCAVDTDRSGRISQSELQSALTQSGINGTKQFSLETCRLMISMLDKVGCGTITFAEFKELWDILNGWKNVFNSYDRDMSGSVDVNELETMVRHMNYTVSRETIDVIGRRYSIEHGGRLALDDFVAAIVKLRAVTEEFRRLDQPARGSITVQYDQFLQIVMKY